MANRTGSIYIVKRCGRLANRIIFYANIIAWAEERKLSVINFTFQSYANLFESTHLTCGSAYPPHKLGFLSKLFLPTIRLLNSIRFQYQCIYLFSKVVLKNNLLAGVFPIFSDHVFDGTKSLSEIIPADYWLSRKTLFVSGWRFREPVLTKKHANKIRDFFKPIEKVRIQIAKSFPMREHNKFLIIGVHIRKGDYANWKGGKYDFPVGDYISIMKKILDLFPDHKLSFLICSNERLDAELFNEFNITISNKSAIEDLYALSMCDLIFGPPSTFTQWASFYGEKPLLHIYNSKEEFNRNSFQVSGISNIPG
jgi:hypothetical protein